MNKAGWQCGGRNRGMEPVTHFVWLGLMAVGVGLGLALPVVIPTPISAAAPAEFVAAPISACATAETLGESRSAIEADRFAEDPPAAQDENRARGSNPRRDSAAAQRQERERLLQLRSEGTREASDVYPAGVPAGLTHYKGREIAQTMHYMGAPWLTREEREAEEKCSLMLANCKVRPGMTVCDMGCGNGFYTFRLAEMVGPHGLVYAVDIQPEMLVLLRDEMERRGVDNIVPILGSVHHPRLPAGQIDAILLADVYHEFSHPEPMLAAMRESLKPTGFAVLLEFRAEDPRVPIKPLHKMSKEQIMKEWPVNGFKLVDQFDGLTWQHMMFFGRDDAP